MSVSIGKLTSGAIKARLTEIATQEKAHAARDLDAEIAAIFKQGGDVDALEAAQLDAERLSRRLRVERLALEAELSNALKREAEASLAAHSAKHAELAEEAAHQINQLAETWQAFRQALEAWEALQASAVSLTEEAGRTASKVEAKMPALGNFLSHRVCTIAVEAQYLSSRLASAEHGMQVGFQVHGHRCD